jgi:hypothetical protein
MDLELNPGPGFLFEDFDEIGHLFQYPATDSYIIPATLGGVPAGQRG